MADQVILHIVTGVMVEGIRQLQLKLFVQSQGIPHQHIDYSLRKLHQAGVKTLSAIKIAVLVLTK